MTITVLFFGAIADIVGIRVKEMDVESSPVAALIEKLIRENPALGRHKVLFSVNQEYVSDDCMLNDGDEIAIFTAVSGG